MRKLSIVPHRAIIRVLIRSGFLMANYLEAAARAVSTRELVKCLEEFSCHRRDGNNSRTVIPFGIDTENMFAIASIAYILHKAELCHSDIRNYELSMVAPILHAAWHDYERKHLQNSYGNNTSCTIEELRQILPSTWIWVEHADILQPG